jgi:hypothetical protein
MKKTLSLIALLLVVAFALFSCGGGDSAGGGNRIMFFSSNWGDNSIMITDDILSLENGATATPRVIVGTNVPLHNPDTDSLTVDGFRGMVYVSDANTGNVIVYNNVATATGNIAPDRTITINGGAAYYGIAIDALMDRLYTTDGSSIYIINNASTANGAVTADAVFASYSEVLFIDQLNDRLFADIETGSPGVNVYDHASTLTNGATPTRTISISQTSVTPYTIWVDATTNKLYYGSRNASSGGYNLFIFNNASTLNGTYDPDTDSTAEIALNELMNVMVDNQDHLYMWSDSADRVYIYNNASTLSGPVSALPDKTILGVVNYGYGMGYLVY